MEDSVKSLMNSRVISVLATTPILVAIDIILTNNFNGLPVTDKESRLIGIVTKYDLILKRGQITDEMKVGDIMNTDPLFLEEKMTVEDAVKAFSEHHRVDPIPVINGDRKVIGIISRYDMVKLFREYGVSSAVSSTNSYPKYQANANTGSSDSDKNDNNTGNNNGILWLIISVIVLGVIIYYFFFVAGR